MLGRLECLQVEQWPWLWICQWQVAAPHCKSQSSFLRRSRTIVLAVVASNCLAADLQLPECAFQCSFLCVQTKSHWQSLSDTVPSPDLVNAVFPQKQKHAQRGAVGDDPTLRDSCTAVVLLDVQQPPLPGEVAVPKGAHNGSPQDVVQRLWKLPPRGWNSHQLLWLSVQGRIVVHPPLSYSVWARSWLAT